MAESESPSSVDEMVETIKEQVVGRMPYPFSMYTDVRFDRNYVEAIRRYWEIASDETKEVIERAFGRLLFDKDPRFRAAAAFFFYDTPEAEDHGVLLKAIEERPELFRGQRNPHDPEAYGPEDMLEAIAFGVSLRSQRKPELRPALKRVAMVAGASGSVVGALAEWAPEWLEKNAVAIEKTTPGTLGVILDVLHRRKRKIDGVLRLVVKELGSDYARKAVEASIFLSDEDRRQAIRFIKSLSNRP